MPVRMRAQIPEEAWLRTQDLLTNQFYLPSKFINELVEHGTSVEFARGRPIYIQGSTADVAYWIVSGLVKISSSFPDGNRLLIKLAGPGDFIGTVDIIDTNRRRMQAFEAEAMTNTRIAIFTRDHVLALLNTLPSAGLVSLLEDANTAWSGLFSSYSNFVGLSLHDRLQLVLKDLAGRFGVPESRGILLTPELSHNDLAEMIASSRSMVSRLIREFIECGRLARQGKHYILLNPKTDVGIGSNMPNGR
jgi:CRP/FNR family cyclic AMP-dependent transcriptional regulator